MTIDTGGIPFAKWRGFIAGIINPTARNPFSDFERRVAWELGRTQGLKDRR